jgi:hypothetical protein
LALATDLFSLPPAERLKRFRELAIEAEAFAVTMITPASRDAYLTIASHWRDLAAQLEKSMSTQTDAREIDEVSK